MNEQRAQSIQEGYRVLTGSSRKTPLGINLCVQEHTYVGAPPSAQDTVKVSVLAFYPCSRGGTQAVRRAACSCTHWAILTAPTLLLETGFPLRQVSPIRQGRLRMDPMGLPAWPQWTAPCPEFFVSGGCQTQAFTRGKQVFNRWGYLSNPRRTSQFQFRLLLSIVCTCSWPRRST